MTGPATIPPDGRRRRAVRLGFLGVGWIGRNRMEAMLAVDGVEAAVMADPSADTLEAARRAAPEAQVCADLDDMLTHPLDGVVIATPSALHAAQAIRCLDHGLSVFCQKPLGRTGAEAAAVVEAAHHADRRLGVDFSYRSTRAMQAVRHVVQSGELGRVYAADLTFHNAYGPDKPWFYDPALSGGGCMMDLGVHLVDLALWLLGADVNSVRGQTFSQGRPGPPRTEAEDFALAQMSFLTGAEARLACSWRLAAGQDAVISVAVYGSEGAVEMRNLNGSFYDFAVDRMRGTHRERLVSPPDDWGGREATTWARGLLDDPGFDPAVGTAVEVARVLDRIYASASLRALESGGQETRPAGAALSPHV